MKKFLLKAVVFIILLLAVNFLIRSFVPYWWGNPGFNQKYKYLQDSRKKYNAVFLGSSRIYRNVRPIYFDRMVKKEKVRSFNMAFAATSNPEHFYLTKKLMLEDWFNFKYVFIELNHFQNLDDKNMHSNRVKYYMNPDIFLKTINVFRESNELNGKLFYNYLVTTVEYLFNINLIDDYIDFACENRCDCNTNIKNLRRLDGFSFFNEKKGSRDYKLRHKPFLRRANKILKRRAKYAYKQYNKYMNEKENFNNSYYSFIEEILKIANEKGCQVVFVVPPRTTQTDIIIPVFNQIPDKNKIMIYDSKEYPQFYSLKYSFDGGHLNKKGAKKFSKILGREFNKLLN